MFWDITEDLEGATRAVEKQWTFIEKKRNFREKSEFQNRSTEFCTLAAL